MIKSNDKDLRVFTNLFAKGFYVFTLLCTLQGVSAQDTLILSTNKSIALNPYIAVYHTPDTLSGTESWNRIQDGSMQEIEEKVNPGMEFPEDAYWALFSLKNPDPRKHILYLEIDYAQMDIVKLYEINRDSVVTLHITGDMFPFDQRPVSSRNIVLPISVTAQSTSTFILSLDKRRSTVRFPLRVYPEKIFLKSQFNNTLFYSFYFGFILLISIASLFLGLVLKKRVFIAYSIYLGAFWLWLFSLTGFSYQFITSDYPELNRHFLPASSQLVIMVLIYYIQTFFETKIQLPKFHRVMNGVLLFFVLGYLFWILFPAKYIAFAPQLFVLRYALVSLVIIFAVFASIRYRRVNRFRSNMFLLAYGLFFAGVFSKIFSEFGFIDETVYPTDPVLMGFFVEILVLSVAMGVILKKALVDRQKLQTENEELLETIEIQSLREKNQSFGFITLKSKATIPTDKLMFIKADDHYLEFHSSEDRPREIDRNTLSRLEKELPAQFVRTHRSVIVNMDYVKATYSNRLLLSNGEELPLTRKYRELLTQKLNGD